MAGGGRAALLAPAEGLEGGGELEALGGGGLGEGEFGRLQGAFGVEDAEEAGEAAFVEFAREGERLAACGLGGFELLVAFAQIAQGGEVALGFLESGEDLLFVDGRGFADGGLPAAICERMRPALKMDRVMEGPVPKMLPAPRERLERLAPWRPRSPVETIRGLSSALTMAARMRALASRMSGRRSRSSAPAV